MERQINIKEGTLHIFDKDLTLGMTYDEVKARFDGNCELAFHFDDGASGRITLKEVQVLGVSSSVRAWFFYDGKLDRIQISLDPSDFAKEAKAAGYGVGQGITTYVGMLFSKNMREHYHKCLVDENERYFKYVEGENTFDGFYNRDGIEFNASLYKTKKR